MGKGRLSQRDVAKCLPVWVAQSSTIWCKTSPATTKLMQRAPAQTILSATGQDLLAAAQNITIKNNNKVKNKIDNNKDKDNN